jgi:hypothetical protein
MFCAAESFSDLVLLFFRWVTMNLAFLTFLYLVVRVVRGFSKKLNIKKEIKKPLVVLISLIAIYNILSIDHIEHTGSILQCKIKGGEILESGCDSIGCYIPFEDWKKRMYGRFRM